MYSSTIGTNSPIFPILMSGSTYSVMRHMYSMIRKIQVSWTSILVLATQIRPSVSLSSYSVMYHVYIGKFWYPIYQASTKPCWVRSTAAINCIRRTPSVISQNCGHLWTMYSSGGRQRNTSFEMRPINANPRYVLFEPITTKCVLCFTLSVYELD